MKTKQHGGQRANSGRKPLPDTLKKKTSVIRIDTELLPLVEKLKQGLSVTQNQVWKQTSALSEDDLKEQANCIERLMTDKAQLSAQVQQLEKQLQKIKIQSDAEIDKLKSELEKLRESKPTPVSYGSSFADKKTIIELKAKIAEFEDNEKVLVAAVRKKILNLSPAELAAINEKLKSFG